MLTFLEPENLIK